MKVKLPSLAEIATFFGMKSGDARVAKSPVTKALFGATIKELVRARSVHEHKARNSRVPSWVPAADREKWLRANAVKPGKQYHTQGLCRLPPNIHNIHGSGIAIARKPARPKSAVAAGFTRTKHGGRWVQVPIYPAN